MRGAAFSHFSDLGLSGWDLFSESGSGCPAARHLTGQAQEQHLGGGYRALSFQVFLSRSTFSCGWARVIVLIHHQIVCLAGNWPRMIRDGTGGHVHKILHGGITAAVWSLASSFFYPIGSPEPEQDCSLRGIVGCWLLITPFPGSSTRPAFKPYLLDATQAAQLTSQVLGFQRAVGQSLHGGS